MKLILAVPVVMYAAQPFPSPAGVWSGVIKLPGMDLGIQIELTHGQAWSGHISIPAQRLKDFELSDIQVAATEISFRMAGIPGEPRFKGRIEAEGIQGIFTQGGQGFPFNLKRGIALAPKRPKLPTGISEREVRVGQDPWVLPGTLTLPSGKGPWPTVVLVHGSGPQDRDETLGPNTPFRDLAWGLAQRGVAVLRYEKRTLVYGATIARDLQTLTMWDETVTDAALAADLLRLQPEVDPRRIFILGHSQGGYMLPRIARKAPFVAGLVSLAGPSRPLEDLIIEQMACLGAPLDQIEEMKAEAARVKTLEKDESATGKLPLGLPKAYFLDLKGYDPAREARDLTQPMLILQGDRDYQVRPADLEGWHRGLDGRKNVRFRRFGNLNHLFMAGEGASTPAEFMKAGHVDEAVLTEISQWISALASPENLVK